MSTTVVLSTRLISINKAYFYQQGLKFISPAGTKTKKGGGVMMLVPKVFSPKTRNDLNLFTGNFESVWVSLEIPTCPSLLVNFTYNTNIFWTNLQLTLIMQLLKTKR